MKSLVQGDDEGKSFSIPPFPDSDYKQFRNMKPRELFGHFMDEDFLQIVADRSNEYGIAKDPTRNPNIDVEDLNIFIGVLLISGYNSVKNYEFYWSQSKDLGNTMVKEAITRDR